MRRYDAYIICTTPRSGSTLLCRMLSRTGIAGRPQFYFHTADVRDWARSLDVPHGPDLMRRTIHAAIAAGTAGTGIFGLRLMRKSFDHLMRQLQDLHLSGGNQAASVRRVFGTTLFIHLTRCDKVAQAVSLEMARQTGLWHRASDGTELERLAPPRLPQYDAAGIARQVAELTAHDRAWAGWFQREGIAPLRLTYEDMSADTNRTLAQVLAELKLDTDAAAPVVPETRRLADDTSGDWISRFRAEHPGAFG